MTEIAIYFREEHVERGRNQQFWGRNQEEPIIFGGGTGRNQEEPGGTRRNWEEPGGTYLVSPSYLRHLRSYFIMRQLYTPK